MIWLLIIFGTAQFSPAATAGRQFHICADNKDITAYFEDRGPKDRRNQYTLNMSREIPAFTDILLYFDSDVSLKLVVGWGFDHQDLLSSTLQQITVPIVSEFTCLKSNPIFFQKKLNTNKFCAGFANGTSACNGDSGGGLMIIVPDRAGDTAKSSGAWYVRGIVSLSPSRTDANICDPYQYTIFTDVEKYRDWVMEYLH